MPKVSIVSFPRVARLRATILFIAVLPVCYADVLCKLLARFFAREARLRPRAGSDDDDEDEATAPVEDILSGDEEETEEGHGLQALLQQLQQLSGHLLAARATPGMLTPIAFVKEVIGGCMQHRVYILLE